MVFKGGGVIGGILFSRTSEAMENGGNQSAALAQDLSTYAPVVGDAMDIMDQGLQISEKKLKNIIERPGDPNSNGNMRARMLRELNGN